jgi:predicted Rossmann fold flavoprotein
MVDRLIHKIIIIGGGPAGLMAANMCSRLDIDFLLLERNNRVGKKLLLTGGSRCNVTNNLSVINFVEQLTIRHNKFLYPSLYAFGPTQIKTFFDQRNCHLILENNFKYFPETNKSQTVIDALMSDIHEDSILYKQKVTKVSKVDDLFIVETTQESYKSEFLIIATGSKSYPKTGSQGDGLRFASSFGIEYKDFTPAETHVYSNIIAKDYRHFQGVSIENVGVHILGTKIKETGDLLFTHFGLSGPVIYHLSEYIYESIQKGKNLIRFSLSSLDEKEIRQILDNPNKHILKQLEKVITKRMSRTILNTLSIDNKKIAEISKKQINDIVDLICRFTVPIEKVEDRENAYVNKGGVILNEINPQSMESKKVPNLFFAGETLDIHGPIGGFNITLALSTAHLAVETIHSFLYKS